MQTPSKMSAPTDSDRPRPPRILTLTACQTDDVSLIAQALSLAASPDSRQKLEDVRSKAVTQSISHNATKVLTYLLTHGAEVPTYSNLVVEEPSKEVLEILLAHGWDINARVAGEQPFLWQIVGDGDLVAWCLDHGTTAAAKPLGLASDEERRRDESGCPPLLEIAASQSTVATFELLRSHGAQSGRRTLHFAARAAIRSVNEGETQPNLSDKARAVLHSERMAMVIHLVDELGLDPNALDQPSGWSLGNHWGTPLCYVARSNPSWDCSEVLRFLIQKGADPKLVIDPAGWDAIELAKRSNNLRFLEIVEEES